MSSSSNLITQFSHGRLALFSFTSELALYHFLFHAQTHSLSFPALLCVTGTTLCKLHSPRLVASSWLLSMSACGGRIDGKKVEPQLLSPTLCSGSSSISNNKVPASGSWLLPLSCCCRQAPVASPSFWVTPWSPAFPPATGQWGLPARANPGAAPLLPFVCPALPTLYHVLSTLNHLYQTTLCGSCFHAWSLTDWASPSALLSDWFRWDQLSSKRDLSHPLCQPESVSLIFTGINSEKWAVEQQKNLQLSPAGWGGVLLLSSPQWELLRVYRGPWDQILTAHSKHPILWFPKLKTPWNPTDVSFMEGFKCMSQSHAERWTSGYTLIFPSL